MDGCIDDVVGWFPRKQTLRWRLPCSVFIWGCSWDQYLGKRKGGEGCQTGQSEKLSCNADPTIASSSGAEKPFRTELRDFPGGPVVNIPQSQCRGPRFDPWSGN